MRIGIDARMYGPEVGGGGLGRYVQELVDGLLQTDHENRYVLFLKPEQIPQVSKKHPHAECIEAPMHWYTAREQLLLPSLIDAQQLDFVHFPHWNVPAILRTPFLITIHDLLLLDEPFSAKATTRNPLVYAAKYLAYRILLKRTLKRAKHIIAVSQHTKERILHHTPSLHPDDVRVIYEGLTPLIEHPHTTPEVTQPYLLYVGNRYPHKNLEFLLNAFDSFAKKHPHALVLAGRQDVFSDQLEHLAGTLGSTDRIHFMHNPSDVQLASLYAYAHAYVFPSRAEGFGLPPLEAMSFSIPVASSHASCLPEILGDAALYFDPTKPQELVRTLERITTDTDLRAQLIERGTQHIKRYRWDDCVTQTHQLYQSIT